MEHLSGVSWPSIVVAALAAFFLGAVYYGPLFGERWQALNQLSAEDIAAGNSTIIFGLAFVLTLVVCVGMAMFIGAMSPAEGSSWTSGLCVGLLCSVLFVATTFGINYLFALKPLALWCIDAGYMVLMFALIGAIIGAWN